MIILYQISFGLPLLLYTYLFQILLNLISYPSAESLRYQDDVKSYNNIQLNDNFSVVLPFLTSTSVLCIFSRNEELLTVLTKILRQFKSLIFDNILQKNMKLCDSIIAFDFYGSLNCSDTFINVSIPTIYIFNSILKTNIPDLDKCLRYVSSPEVVVFSILDDSLYELSPVFPRPRSFKKSSILEVLKHRTQPTKLDLAGSTLTVATMDYFPFFIIEDRERGEFDGIEEQLIDEMSRQLNFSPSYLIYNNWGKLMPTGTWVGQVGGAMQEGLAELAIANLWQIPSLYTVMDFGPSLTKEQLGFLVRRPERIGFQWRSVVTIFKPWLWFAIFVTFVMVVGVYWAGVNWDLHSHSESWAGSVMTVLGHLLMATFHRRVRNGNTRYTLTSWSVFSLLLTTFLSTGIVTRLTLPQYTARLDTTRQLVEGHHYWSVEFYRRFRPNKLMREFMFNLEDPWAYAIENTYTFMEVEDILWRVKTDSKIAIPVEKYEKIMINIIPGLLEQEALKKFRFCKEPNSETHVSIGFKKKSPFFEFLSVLNLKFIEVGLVKHWRNEVDRRYPQYDTSHLSVEHDIPMFGEPEHLILDKVRPVFYLLLFGLAIASLVFVVEVYW